MTTKRRTTRTARIIRPSLFSSTKKGPRNGSQVCGSSQPSLSFPSRTTSYKIARHVILSFQFEPDGRVAPGACQDQRTRGLPAQRKMKSARRRRMMERMGQARCLETLADIATVESNSGEREKEKMRQRKRPLREESIKLFFFLE